MHQKSVFFLFSKATILAQACKDQNLAILKNHILVNFQLISKFYISKEADFQAEFNEPGSHTVQLSVRPV